MILKTYGWSFAILIVGLVLAVIYDGPTALGLVAILCVLEISLSFDNAVVNATILRRMNDFWQKIFLSVGVIIAVFGMRLVFPLLLVSITAKLGPVEAVRLALEKGPVEEPGSYGYLLNEAHPTIAAFGGMFLLMLFLGFIFSESEHHWLGPVERFLEKLGRVEALSVIVAGVVLFVVSETYASDHAQTVLASGLLGMVTYLLVDGLGNLFNVDEVEGDDEEGAAQDAAAVPDQPRGSRAPSDIARVGGKAAFFLFLYLEVLDASFSFDGVIGAFAITNDPIIIAIGLGVGAMFIRSMTVHLVREGTLSQYIYLENGALWAIGALAAILLLSIEIEIPEVVTGLIGVAFIVAALISSILHNRAHPEDAHVEQKAHAEAH
ncbi:DUF475 domain-containing protein [Kineococcus rubinsiae]|uniref:DUF475 domain-containing protein n=1 Tax=Kineococcus rubinsiae TaxID=2609562 RepID=UPI0014311A0A|nr:DUF475 domain-containing protein [Kineococcus rubinsiae]NIZ90987.1 DUF475 domain-containing protein [Kineococcus rubinsiae]